MAINWSGLDTELRTIFSLGNNNESLSDLAQEIEDAYVTAITTAVETSGMNTVLSFNTGQLKTGIENAFTTCLNTNGSLFNISLVDSGLIHFWMGSTFSPVTPAAGMSTVTEINTTNGGLPVYQTPPVASDSVTPWINMWINYFQSHALTVSGELIGLSSAPTPAPIIVPFVGIQ